jgi:enoyl-CoA hydratase
MTEFMPKTEYLRVEEKDHIAIVSMGRPPVNAANQQFYQEMLGVFDALGADPEIRVAILRSDFPKYWCAGNDIKDFAGMTPMTGHIRHRIVYNSFMALYDCAVPVIAAIDGYALGTGLCYAAVCDFIIASDQAVLGAPEMNVGVLGPGNFLRRLVPEMVMRRMYFTGAKVPAKELEPHGALTVVPQAELMERAMELAVGIAEKVPTTVRLGKEVLNKTEYMDVKSGFATEQYYTRRAGATEDAHEAQKAFLEKRKPVFHNR